MSDTFDPNAWHGSGGAHSAPSDDYENLAFDDPQTDYGDPQTDYGDQDPYGLGDGLDHGIGDSLDLVSTTSPGAHARPGTGDDDDYDDDQFDKDEFDNYDDFGGESSEGRGLVGKLIAGGAVVFLVIVVGVLISSAVGGGKSKAQASKSAPSSGSSAAKGRPVVQQTTSAPQDVTDAMNKAFAAWGQFALTGDVNTVRPYFVNGGRQLDNLEAEAPSFQAKPQTGAALGYQMTNSTAVKTDDNNWIIHGTVVTGRPGEQPVNHPWEVSMRRASPKDPWQILSVRQY